MKNDISIERKHKHTYVTEQIYEAYQTKRTTDYKDSSVKVQSLRKEIR